MCKTAEHGGGHNVVPLKMLINKSDDMIKKKKEALSQEVKGEREKQAEDCLKRIEALHEQNMFILKYFVEMVSRQIMKCEQVLIDQYESLKKIVNEQVNL